MKNNRITIRIEPEEREQLDRLISEGKIKNLTEPIYKALKQALAETA
jgi:Arc/MetJ-type ribon-helix-helix transcriptional regulator